MTAHGHRPDPDDWMLFFAVVAVSLIAVLSI